MRNLIRILKAMYKRNSSSRYDKIRNAGYRMKTEARKKTDG